MEKYKFKHAGAQIFMRGRDPISPESLTDKQVDELVERHPELKDQFEGLPEPIQEPVKSEKPRAEKLEEKKA